jgi:3-keto-5-aminohexanoate cleavage enzyme
MSEAGAGIEGPRRGDAPPPVIVNFTPTGMIPTKAMTPHVPITPQEIIADVLEAVDIGITMVHLHAREAGSGRPTCHADVYREIIEGIRKFADDLVICVSLSGRTVTEFSSRAEPLALSGTAKPDMGSLTLSSVNFNQQASVNEPETIKALAGEMKQRGILPELEMFDLGMVNYARYLERKGLLSTPHYANLILGNIACAQVDLLHIGVMLKDLPADTRWSLGGIGSTQLVANSVAIACGGGVRVGLEDNIWFDPQRSRLARNADLIHHIHLLAEANGRTVMKPAALRQLLRLEPGRGRYGRGTGAPSAGR